MFDASALSPETIRLCVDALRFGKIEREHGIRPDYARVEIALARVEFDLSIARQARLLRERAEENVE
jgi:hypothetical protein